MAHLKSENFRVFRGALNLPGELYEMVFHTLFSPSGMEENEWIKIILRNVIAVEEPWLMTNFTVTMSSFGDGNV
jgi:hypothetical protein